MIKRQITKSCLFIQIGNADHMAVYFDMSRQTVALKRGARSVFMKVTVAEKQKWTVMLAVADNGHKFSSFVIFKRNTFLKGSKCPPGIHV